MGKIFIEIRDKADMSANITTEYHATGVCSINQPVIPDATFPPSLLTHSEVAQFRNIDSEWDAIFNHSKILGRLLLCLEHQETLCQPTRMMIRWLTFQKCVIK
jgi:hypothetical protein